ncbi:MAG: PorP/SprF family type IX secretion system membrane protein [Bacteroidetes bacterium]|nr:PorP/SprF family type IX secretion system membrane protein [Bacteroidota bacterium]
MKKLLYLFGTAIAIFFVATLTSAQDVHFSQFDAAPHTVNPANTGNYTGDWKLTNTFRSQWTTVSRPYRTISMGFDRQFYLQNDIFSAGILLVQDRSGTIGSSNTSVYLTEAYQKEMNKHTFHLGLQTGYVSKGFSTREMTFPNQFDMETGYFNPDMESYETRLDVRSSYFDLNTGILWTYTGRRLQVKTGGALYHINRPKDAYMYRVNTDEKGKEIELPVRKVVHGNVRLIVSDNLLVMPGFAWMTQAGANELLAGINARYSFGDEYDLLRSVYTGVSFRGGNKRVTDAVIIGAGASTRKIELRLSYDINVSPLKVASNYHGAIEISLLFKAISTRHEERTSPFLRF